MATTPASGAEAKIDTKIDAAKADAAAEKAYAQAAEKVEPAAVVTAAPAAPVTVAKPAVAAKIAAKPETAKPAVAKPAAAKQTVAKQTGTKKAVAKKAAAKPAASKPVIKKIVTAAAKPAAKVTPFNQIKDTIMTKTKATTEDYTAKIKDAMSTAQDKAKAAFEKTSAYATGYGEFTKGNLDAVVESGKILAAGLQDMGKTYMAEGKSAVETITADVKEIAGVKTPADFFKLQGEMMRRNFDAAVATTSKHSEAMVKLAGDAFAPISTRVSLAVEKVKQAA